MHWLVPQQHTPHPEHTCSASDNVGVASDNVGVASDNVGVASDNVGVANRTPSKIEQETVLQLASWMGSGWDICRAPATQFLTI